MSNLDLTITEIMHGDTEVLKIMKGDEQKWPLEVIEFEDSAVKTICVANWGGTIIPNEITNIEAAKVTTLSNKFQNNTTITKFNELRYFTGLTNLYISGNGTSAVGSFSGCSNLTEITIPQANITDARGAFRSCSKLTSLDLSPITASTVSMHRICHSCTSLVTLTLPNASIPTMTYFVRGCSKLETINARMSIWNTGGYNTPFYGCSKLSTITGSISGIIASLDFGACPLTRDSAMVIINGLANATSKTLTLSATTKALLSSEDIAIATGKGWAIA